MGEDERYDAFTVTVPESEELRALTREFFHRAQRGIGMHPQQQVFPAAKIHECLANVNAWIKEHPGDTMVMGFIYFDFDYALNHVRFTPHVVVYTADGRLLDVTPHGAEGDHPFLQIEPEREPLFWLAFKNGPMDLIYR